MGRCPLLGPSWVGFMKSMWVAVSLDTLPSWKEVMIPKLTSALLSHLGSLGRAKAD